MSFTPINSDRSFQVTVPVNSASTYVEIARIRTTTRYPYLPSSRGMFVIGEVTGAALTHFKMSFVAKVGDTEVVVLEDTDFNTATLILPYAKSNIYQTADGSNFQFILDRIDAVAEIVFYAKSVGGGATVVLTGTVR